MGKKNFDDFSSKPKSKNELRSPRGFDDSSRKKPKTKPRNKEYESPEQLEYDPDWVPDNVDDKIK